MEDRPNLVTKAMNGWADPEPDWWLNLLAHPDARVDLVAGPRPVRGRAASENERPRLWARWAVHDKRLDACATLPIAADPGRPPGATVRLTGRGTDTRVGFDRAGSNLRHAPRSPRGLSGLLGPR